MTKAYRQIDNQIWMLVALMATLVVASFLARGMSVAPLSNPPLLFGAMAYWLVVGLLCFFRRGSTVSKLLVLMGQIFAISFLGYLLTYAASTTPVPYRDAELHAIDGWLGFDRTALRRFLEGHPDIVGALNSVYWSIGWQSLSLPPILILSGRVLQAQKYALAFGVSLIATSLIASFVPAQSAFVFVDLSARGLTEPPAEMHRFYTILDSLHNGTMRTISLQDVEGVITFPSFHTTCAILFAWAAWGLPLGKWVFLLLNVLMIVSIPTEGGHYLVDLVGGALVAAATIAFVQRWSGLDATTLALPMRIPTRP